MRQAPERFSFRGYGDAVPYMPPLLRGGGRASAAGGVAGRMHGTCRALVARPLSRLRRQLPLKGAPREAHHYPRRVYTPRSGREANPRSAMHKCVVTFRDTDVGQAGTRFTTGRNAIRAPKRFSFRGLGGFLLASTKESLPALSNATDKKRRLHMEPSFYMLAGNYARGFLIWA